MRVIYSSRQSPSVPVLTVDVNTLARTLLKDIYFLCNLPFPFSILAFFFSFLFVNFSDG